MEIHFKDQRDISNCGGENDKDICYPLGEIRSLPHIIHKDKFQMN